MASAECSDSMVVESIDEVLDKFEHGDLVDRCHLPQILEDGWQERVSKVLKEGTLAGVLLLRTWRSATSLLHVVLGLRKEVEDVDDSSLNEL